MYNNIDKLGEMTELTSTNQMEKSGTQCESGNVYIAQHIAGQVYWNACL